MKKKNSFPRPRSPRENAGSGPLEEAEKEARRATEVRRKLGRQRKGVERAFWQ